MTRKGSWLLLLFLAATSCAQSQRTGRVLDDVRLVREALNEAQLEPERSDNALLALEKIEKAVLAWKIDDARGSFAVDTRPVEIQLSFASGAVDRDGDGSDDGIDVLIQPKDKYGDTVKTVGSFTIELKRRPILNLPVSQLVSVCRWQKGPEEANDAWFESTFSGFFFHLEWPGDPPSSGLAALEATFLSRLGRTLHAEKFDIRINTRGTP